jgi:hypothetical protein
MLHRKYLLRQVNIDLIRKYDVLNVLFELGYGIEVDCWATGIISYILLCGYPPFKTADRNQEVLFQLIQRGKFLYDAEYWGGISASKILKKSICKSIFIIVIYRCKKFN